MMGRKSSSSNCYTSKSLTYRVVQLLMPSKVALNPKEAKFELLLIDTSVGIFLGQKRKFPRGSEDKMNHLLAKWSSRPFQYSSAVNPSIAAIVVHLIHDLIIQERKTTLNSHISMGDVTCGSGTFLALSMGCGMEVYGFDINEKCVEGTKRNLEFLFGKDLVKAKCHMRVQDSSSSTAAAAVGNDDNDSNDSALFDCVISNLPWGRNTMMNMEENKVCSCYFAVLPMFIFFLKN